MSTPPKTSTAVVGSRLQFILGFAFLSFLLASVVLASTYSFNRMRAQTYETIEIDVRLSQLADRVANATLLCRRYEKDIFLNIADPQQHSDYMTKWEAAFTTLQSAITTFEQAAVTSDDTAQVSTWRAESQLYQRAVLDVDQAIRAGTITSPSAANAALAPAKDPIRTLTDTALSTAESKAALAEQANAELNRMMLLSLYLVDGLGVLAIVVAVIWSGILLTRLLRPIGALQATSNKLAAGDFTARVPVLRHDELGRLATTFNIMADTIQQRTDALEGRNAHLLEANQRQQQLLETIKQLSTPLLPLTDDVVVLPIVGHVDSSRAQDIMTTLLRGVAEHRARVAILDISGIVTVDTHVMSLLLQPVQAVRLLGADVLLAGISAQMAQMIVEQGVQLGGLRTYQNLQMALNAALTPIAKPYT